MLDGRKDKNVCRYFFVYRQIDIINLEDACFFFVSINDELTIINVMDVILNLKV